MHLKNQTVENEKERKKAAAVLLGPHLCDLTQQVEEGPAEG